MSTKLPALSFHRMPAASSGSTDGLLQALDEAFTAGTWGQTPVHVPEERELNLLCPKCGHVEGLPAEAGDCCPVCQKAEIETRLEAIDPDVLKALLPFAPEQKLEPPSSENGHLWLYAKQPVALPASSSFQVLTKFGERDTPVEQFVKGLSDEPAKPTVRVSLFGFYTNAIEIS